MKLFQRVALQGAASSSLRTGRVVGFGTIVAQSNGSDTLRQTLIVELDQGFYSEDKKTWVTWVVADESNVTSIL